MRFPDAVLWQAKGDASRCARQRQPAATYVDEIPILWAAPVSPKGAPLGLWLPPLGAEKEWAVPILAIAFELGGDDLHVPATGAQRFQTALRELDPRAADAVRITLHPGLDHLDGLRNPGPRRRALDWLQAEDTPHAAAARPDRA